MINKFLKKNKNNNSNENNDTQQVEEVSNKKTQSIVDRGLKFNIAKIENEKNSWKKFAFGSSILTLAAMGLAFYFSSTTKMFIVDSRGAPVELQQLQKLPFTEARVKTFADEAISRIYGLNYRYINEQLNAAKIYIDSTTYTTIIQEMERSNYIAAIKQKKEIITITPTNEINKFKMLTQDDLVLTRTFIREKISGDTIKRENVTLDINIQRVLPTELHPWGLTIKSIKEMSVKEY